MEQTKGLAIFISNEIMEIECLSFLEKGILAKIGHLDNENHCWASNKYLADYFGVSEKTISRAISKLNDLGYVKSKMIDGRHRIITTLDNLSKQNRQNVQADRTECPANNINNNISNNIDIKCIQWNFPSKKNSSDLDYFVLEKQIVKCCKSLGYDFNEDRNTVINAIKVVKYYYETYFSCFGENHPILSNKAMTDMLYRFFSGSEHTEDMECDYEEYCILIDKHFETYYEDCDYNICHFMTDGIRDNRFYETLY